MGLTKTFIGYHKDDGGKVYKESFGSNSLYSNTYCTKCSKSTVGGSLIVSSEVTTDMTTVAQGFTDGNIPDTDAEYLDAFLKFCSDWNLSTWANAFGALTSSKPYAVVDKIARVNGAILLQQTATLEEYDRQVGLLGQALSQNAALADGSVGTMPALSSDNTSAYNYWYNWGPLTATGALIDTSVGADITNPAADLRFFRQSDPTVQAVIQSHTFTVPDTVNRIYLSAHAIKSYNGDAYQDWTRGTTATIHCSTDGGSTWTPMKFIKLDDWINFNGSTTYSNLVADMAVTPGTLFEWKVTMKGHASQFNRHALSSLTAKLYYLPTEDVDEFAYFKNIRYV